jgi:hypothetical protein
MASSAGGSIWYVYGIVPAALSPATVPAGLDDASVRIERHNGGRTAALVSLLDAQQYGPEVIETNSGDVEWLSPRAVAHDRVLTWASDLGPVVPLPMFSLFSGPEAVHRMLADRSEQLEATLARVGAGREYALRVYRVDRELLGAIATLSPRLEQMAAAAAAASPGQRYLLERKLDAEKKSEMRAVTQQLVDETVDALSALALRTVRSPIPRAADADNASRGVMVLNAAFLVAPAAIERFQQTLTDLVERHGAHGLRFDFTGPWPPYHFAGDGLSGDND